MKTISLWQPWASAMAIGAKKNETRHWSTKYRGPLAIHAAKRYNRLEMIGISCQNCWTGIFRRLNVSVFLTMKISGDMPFGAVVAIGNLVSCRPTDSFTQEELDTERVDLDHRLYPWTERDMGNYDLGRFGWGFETVLALPEPIPYRGSQGFFDVPDELFDTKTLEEVRSWSN